MRLANASLEILGGLKPEEQAEFAPPPIVEAIVRMREGRVLKAPCYDGVYGKTRISA